MECFCQTIWIGPGPIGSGRSDRIGSVRSDRVGPIGSGPIRSVRIRSDPVRDPMFWVRDPIYCVRDPIYRVRNAIFRVPGHNILTCMGSQDTKSVQMPSWLPPLCLDCLLWSWLRGWTVGLPIYRRCPIFVRLSGQAILQQTDQSLLLSNRPLLLQV